MTLARSRGLFWATILAVTFLIGCGDATYEPTPGRLVGEFSGRAGEGFQTYDLFLTVQQVDDSVRGLWSLAFVTTCSTHDGPFSGILDGDQIRPEWAADLGAAGRRATLLR